MSITAAAMRCNGYTWAEIAEHLSFVSPEAARDSAQRAVYVTGGEPLPPEPDDEER